MIGHGGGGGDGLCAFVTVHEDAPSREATEESKPGERNEPERQILFYFIFFVSNEVEVETD